MVRKVASLLCGGLEARDARSVGSWSYILMGGLEVGDARSVGSW